eukprot:CAMPEP_0179174174 /NCGR_PEP_ID=MMETSP0796-20121207/85985_1 /TAXON_ID=73915 /ORGANISM="Pyrodinium bahamense, Strain pbaha01" /LENGTH=56 /DNA_ID=CAMNT_0020877459 /DNA_START=66 /DNA_END=236 /DNA_ORIENTATION=-
MAKSARASRIRERRIPKTASEGQLHHHTEHAVLDCRSPRVQRIMSQCWQSAIILHD